MTRRSVGRSAKVGEAAALSWTICPMRGSAPINTLAMIPLTRRMVMVSTAPMGTLRLSPSTTRLSSLMRPMISECPPRHADIVGAQRIQTLTKHWQELTLFGRTP